MQQLQDGHGSQILRPTWFEDETKAVWTRKYMEAKRGHVLLQMWNDPYEVTTEDILRAASAAARPSARLPDSQFLRALCTDDVSAAPPQTRALSLRAPEEWERFVRTFSILDQAQEADRSSLRRRWTNASVYRPGPPDHLTKLKHWWKTWTDSSLKLRQSLKINKHTHCLTKW